jgi:hypothetical protein
MQAILYPPYFFLLNADERAVLETIVSCLTELKFAIGLVWGGSTSRLTTRDELADVDLWLLVRDGMVRESRDELLRALANVKNASFVLAVGEFDFFGDLVSSFFFPGCVFGVDIGICTLGRLKTATPGEKSILLWGVWPDAADQRESRRTGPAASRRLDVILTNLIKVRKALARGYFWNAIEYTSRARRELMGLMVGDGPMRETRYSRADHSIEKRMSSEDRQELAFTCPHYSRPSIAACASKIGQMSIRWAEEAVIPWPPISELSAVTESILTAAKPL